jgi:hypothetical protein
MSFDWKAEILAPAALTATRVQTTRTAVPASAPITFAQALTSSHNAATNEYLPQPSIRGETVFIRISQAPYEKGIEVCKMNLHGRLDLNKEDKPYTSKDIQIKLQKQWKIVGPWTLLPLGRGFYEFYFASESDLCIV